MGERSPGRLRFSLAALLALALAGGAGAEPLDLRGVATPVEIWRWRGSTQSILAGVDLLFVAGKGRVSALDPRDGELLWTTVIGSESEDCGCGHGAHVQVGDRLFVPIAESVAVLDTNDGALLARLHLGGTVHHLLGPPVIAQADGEESSILVRFDERSGAELARRELASVYSLERFDDRFTLLLRLPAAAAAAGERSAPQTVAVGLDDDLQEQWRLPLRDGSMLSRDSDHLVVADTSEGSTSRRPLDPRNGELGAPLPDGQAGNQPSHLSCGDGNGGPALELAWTVSEARGRATSPSRVTRGGKERWESDELPGWPQQCVRWGDRLLLRLNRGGSRDLLAVLRAKTGERENLLYLEPGISDLFVAADRVVLQKEDGLIGIDALDAGPSEAQSRSLAESVAAILANDGGADQLEILADLEALGPEALPFAVAALPHLDGPPLLAVAQWVAKSGYAPAAGLLAAALDRTAAAAPAPAPTGAPAKTAQESNVRIQSHRAHVAQLAAALAAIAGPPQVPLLARYVSPRWPEACPAAFAALGRIGTLEAVAALDGVLAAANGPPAPWFHPPRPPRSGAVTPAAARRAIEEMEARDSFDAYMELMQGLRSAEVRIGKQPMLIFPAADLGGDGDLWISEVGTAGKPGSSTASYLGNVGGCGSIIARVVGGELRVECGGQSVEALFAAASGAPVDAAEMEAAAPAPAPSFRVRLGAWRRDGDGDGLSDLLERRLGLDPARADSDGDGLADGVDRAPNAQPRRPADRPEDELLLSALAGIWACDPSGETGVVRYVAGAPALQWRGRRGVTLTLGDTPPANTALGWNVMAIEGDSPSALVAGDNSPLAPGERRVNVRFGTGTDRDDGPVWSVVLRRIGERWVVSRFESGLAGEDG